MDTQEAMMTSTPLSKPGKRPLPGTPIGKDHEIYNIGSPSFHPFSKSTRTEESHINIPPPTTPPSATTSATLSDIAHLLQQQLAPITQELSEVKASNHAMQASMKSTMQGVKEELKQQIDDLDDRLTQLEISKANLEQSEKPPQPEGLTPPGLSDRLKDIETDLANLKLTGAKQPGHAGEPSGCLRWF